MLLFIPQEWLLMQKKYNKNTMKILVVPGAPEVVHWFPWIIDEHVGQVLSWNTLYQVTETETP